MAAQQPKLSLTEALERLHIHVVESAAGKISSTQGIGQFYSQAGSDGPALKEAFKAAGGLKKATARSEHLKYEQQESLDWIVPVHGANNGGSSSGGGGGGGTGKKPQPPTQGGKTKANAAARVDTKSNGAPAVVTKPPTKKPAPKAPLAPKVPLAKPPVANKQALAKGLRSDTDRAAGGVQISSHKAMAQQQQDFGQLKPGVVACWLKKAFKLKAGVHLTVHRSEHTFQVELDPAVAVDLLKMARDGMKLNDIPVRVGMWPGGKGGAQQARPKEGPLRGPRRTAEQPPQQERRDGPPDASDDVNKFWRRLQIAVEARKSSEGTEQLKLHEPANHVHWMACWSVAAAGAPGSCEVLLRVLLNAPAKTDIAPPAEDVVQVLCRIVRSLKTQNEGQQLQALHVLEQVADAIETRLIGHEAKVTDVDGVLEHAQTLLTAFMVPIRGVMSGGTQQLLRSGKLMGLFTNVVQRYQDSLQRARNAPRDAPSAITNAPQLDCWLRWQQPTIGWLMSDTSTDSWLRLLARLEPHAENP